MSDMHEAAELLGGDAYPNGEQWRCMRCDFTCGDDGPDYCPHDGSPLTRTALTFPIRPLQR
jgi:rubrerythrin